MSEYQYYEFAAVDRPLTAQQQAELRNRSSRATITASSFVNEYHWGDLKGEPLDWMQRYFDAHVYSANWGSCRLLLRLPESALDKSMLDDCTRPSASGAAADFLDAFEVTATSGYSILDWSFNDDSGELARFWSQADGPGWMARLLPLRDELLRGDTRPLYLGWLARVCAGELAGDDAEPPLPAGLATLSPAQAALAEFLLLDPDWLTAAAEASPTLPAQDEAASDFDAWLDEQSPTTVRTTLRLLLEGRGQEAERGVRQAFLTWQRARQQSPVPPTRRTVAQIESGVAPARARRLERERQARAAEQARQQSERMAYFTRLAQHPDQVWQEIGTTLQRGSGTSYNQALRLTQELAEALTQAGREAEFRRGLVKLLGAHGKRAAWVARLEKAGLLRKPKS